MLYGDLQFFDIIIFAVIAVFIIYRSKKCFRKKNRFQKQQEHNQNTIEEKDVKETKNQCRRF